MIKMPSKKPSVKPPKSAQKAGKTAPGSPWPTRIQRDSAIAEAIHEHVRKEAQVRKEAEAKADVERRRAAVEELNARALRIDDAAAGIARALAEAFESLPKDPAVRQALHKSLGTFMEEAARLRERVVVIERDIPPDGAMPRGNTYKKVVPITLAGTGPVQMWARIEKDDPSRVMVYVQRQHSFVV